MPTVLVPDNAFEVTPRHNLDSGELEAKWQQRFFLMLKEAGVAEIKKIVGWGLFKRPSGQLVSSIGGEVREGGVSWFAEAPHAEALEKGVRSHVMWNLKDRVVPILIHKYGGQVKVYRKASMKALLAGKFRHPGFPGKHFMRRGIQQAIREIPKLLAQAREAVVVVL